LGDEFSAFRASSWAEKNEGQNPKTLPSRLATRGGTPVALPESRILRAGKATVLYFPNNAARIN